MKMTRFYQLFITGASKELTKSKHKGKNNQEKFLKYGQDPAEKKKKITHVKQVSKQISHRIIIVLINLKAEKCTFKYL